MLAAGTTVRRCEPIGLRSLEPQSPNPASRRPADPDLAPIEDSMRLEALGTGCD
jgi:hypothetical protein